MSIREIFEERWSRIGRVCFRTPNHLVLREVDGYRDELQRLADRLDRSTQQPANTKTDINVNDEFPGKRSLAYPQVRDIAHRIPLTNLTTVCCQSIDLCGESWHALITTLSASSVRCLRFDCCENSGETSETLYWHRQISNAFARMFWDNQHLVGVVVEGGDFLLQSINHVMRAVAHHKSLKLLNLDGAAAPLHEIADMIRENRVLETLVVQATDPLRLPQTAIDHLQEIAARSTELPRVLANSKYFRDGLANTAMPEFEHALKDNWTLRRVEVEFGLDTCVICGHTSSHRVGCAVRATEIRNDAIKWEKTGARIAEMALALAPLRLATYDVLWILDWLSPMNKRFIWRNRLDHDPHHLKKVRLIERVNAAYQRAAARKTSAANQ